MMNSNKFDGIETNNHRSLFNQSAKLCFIFLTSKFRGVSGQYFSPTRNYRDGIPCTSPVARRRKR